MKYLKLIRYQNLLLLAFMQLLFRYGFLKFQNNIVLSLSDWQYGLLVLATILIAAAGYIINDIFDQEDTISALKAGQPKSVVKHWMYANSIHLIDLFRVFCRGSIINVNSILKWNSKVPCTVLSKITFDSGDIGIYQAIWNAPAPWMLTLSTPFARYEMRPIENAYEQLAGTRQQIKLEIDNIDIIYKAGIKVQADEFVNILKGKEHTLPNLEDAFETMKLINKIYEI